jgi:hypothetical protein
MSNGVRVSDRLLSVGQVRAAIRRNDSIGVAGNILIEIISVEHRIGLAFVLEQVFHLGEVLGFVGGVGSGGQRDCRGRLGLAAAARIDALDVTAALLRFKAVGGTSIEKSHVPLKSGDRRPSLEF